MMTRSRRPVYALVALCLALGALTGCDPIIGTVSGPVRRATLTSESGAIFHYAGNRSVVFAQPAAGSTDGNVREVFWYPDSAFAADQQNCVTWNTIATSQSGGLLQPGVSMRIAPTGPGGTGVKAITVTENIWYAGVWVFNVHVWNSTNRTNPFTQIASFDLSSIVGKFTLTGNVLHSTLVPPPWHVCARTIANTFSFMVWTGSKPQPSWSDPSRVYTVKLPAGWDYPGYAGGYVGHLRPHQAAVFTAVTNGPLR